MNVTTETNVAVTTFCVKDPPTQGAVPPHPWEAVASAHVYNPHSRPSGLHTQEQAVLSGEAFEVVTARASGVTEESAARGALGLLFQRLQAARERR